MLSRILKTHVLSQGRRSTSQRMFSSAGPAPVGWEASVRKVLPEDWQVRVIVVVLTRQEQCLCHGPTKSFEWTPPSSIIMRIVL